MYFTIIFQIGLIGVLSVCLYLILSLNWWSDTWKADYDNFLQSDESRTSLEVSPESGVLIQEIAARIEKEGGYSLLIDYGHDGTKSDTFRVLI